MNPVSTETATKLPIDQDAWLLHRLDKLEKQQSVFVEAGRERFWSNRGNETLELLAIKTKI
jgi:hypothetical protein